MATLPAAIPGTPVLEYAVGDEKVVVSDAGVRHHSTVIEPALSDRERELYSELMNSLYHSYNPEQGSVD